MSDADTAAKVMEGIGVGAQGLAGLISSLSGILVKSLAGEISDADARKEAEAAHAFYLASDTSAEAREKVAHGNVLDAIAKQKAIEAAARISPAPQPVVLVDPEPEPIVVPPEPEPLPPPPPAGPEES